MRTITLLLLFVSLQLSAADDLFTDIPDHKGLQLRLRIENGEDESHTIQVELLNKRKERVELSTTDAREYLRKAVLFKMFPEVAWYAPQVGVSLNSKVSDKKPVLQTIEPGGSILSEWKTKGPHLKEQDKPSDQWFYHLPPGLYFARATLTVVIRDESAKLWSNEQPFIVGGSRNAPKPPTALITTVNDAAKSVTIDIGSRDGVEIGDRYGIPVMASPSWLMTVTKVEDSRVEAMLIEAQNSTFPDWKPQLPQPSTKVIWVPKTQ